MLHRYHRGTVATADNDSPARSSGTPVPPRGGKKKSPARPSASSSRPGGARPSASQRSANNRRAAVAAQRRRRNTLLAITAVGVVIIVVAVLVIVKVTGGGKTNVAVGSGINQPVSAAQYNELASIPASTLARAANNFHDTSSTTPLTYPQPIKGPAYTVDGKPGGFYLGAEYCPYCAGERWAVVLALSKFGTWSGLQTMKSSSTDVFPDTPTFTLLKATFASKYFGFDHWEQETRTYKPLQTPSATASKLFGKYNLQQGIPFVYLDGKYLINEIQYDDAFFRPGGGQNTPGMSFKAALASVTSGSTALSAHVEAAAGSIVADVCKITHGQPGSVCKYFPKAITSPDVTPGDLATSNG